jgi:signal transduction histidine kinase
VFANLLDNACKYTPAGGSIALEAIATADMLQVTVRDSGIGISAEMLPRVFDLFVQDAGAAVVNRSGLGIGLAVVRELVAAHGGTVAASSGGAGGGSSFVVSLPLLREPPATQAPALVPQSL